MKSHCNRCRGSRPAAHIVKPCDCCCSRSTCIIVDDVVVPMSHFERES